MSYKYVEATEDYANGMFLMHKGFVYKLSRDEHYGRVIIDYKGNLKPWPLLDPDSPPIRALKGPKFLPPKYWIGDVVDITPESPVTSDPLRKPPYKVTGINFNAKTGDYHYFMRTTDDRLVIVSEREVVPWEEKAVEHKFKIGDYVIFSFDGEWKHGSVVGQPSDSLPNSYSINGFPQGCLTSEDRMQYWYKDLPDPKFKPYEEVMFDFAGEKCRGIVQSVKRTPYFSHIKYNVKNNEMLTSVYERDLSHKKEMEEEPMQPRYSAGDYIFMKDVIYLGQSVVCQVTKAYPPESVEGRILYDLSYEFRTMCTGEKVRDSGSWEHDAHKAENFLCVAESDLRPYPVTEIHVGIEGDDLHGDGSEGDPYRTLPRALEAIPASHAPHEIFGIKVHPGDYDMPVHLPNDNGISIVGVPDEDGNKPHFKGSAGVETEEEEALKHLDEEIDKLGDTVGIYPAEYSQEPSEGLQKEYLDMQATCGLQVGDWVNILRAPACGEGGWWCSAESKAFPYRDVVGYMGKITHVTSEGISVDVKLSNAGDRYRCPDLSMEFPFFVLEKTTKPRTVTQDELDGMIYNPVDGERRWL